MEDIEVVDLADRLAIRDLRFADISLDLELALQAVDDNLQVEFTHSGNNRLTALLIDGEQELQGAVRDVIGLDEGQHGCHADPVVRSQGGALRHDPAVGDGLLLDGGHGFLDSERAPGFLQHHAGRHQRARGTRHGQTGHKPHG